MTTRMRSAPPAPPAPPCKSRKPGGVSVYRALYDYTAQASDELSFVAGDLLYVSDAKTGDKWLRATCGSVSGLIPHNYVVESAEVVLNLMHDCAMRGRVQPLMELISHEVSVNGQDSTGCTPLHWAARGGHIDCVQALLSCDGVMIDVQNLLGETPLHLAASRSRCDVVRALLAAGADASIVNSDQKTAAQLAENPACAALFAPKPALDTAHMSQYGTGDSDSD